MTIKTKLSKILNNLRWHLNKILVLTLNKFFIDIDYTVSCV